MSRRGENIYKRKDGRWEGRFIKHRKPDNRAEYGYVYGKSYAEVKEKLRFCCSESNKAVNSHSEQFGKIAAQWYENKKLNVKESTLARYKSLLNIHILPLLGEYEVRDIYPELIQNYLNSLLSKGFSRKTANDILTVIKNILKFAEIKNCKLSFPLNSILVKTKKQNIEVLTIPEEKRLCAYLFNNINNKNLGILLCLCTGIRLGEVCALKWSDIDLEERVINISKTMLRIQCEPTVEHIKTKIIITEPKSDCSARSIPVSDSLAEIISALSRDADSYVLTNNKNAFIEPRNMQYYFKSVLKKCGLVDYRFHALRHTFATRCVENGFEIKSLSEILGHSNVKITLERYVHSTMDLKRKNMNKINFFPDSRHYSYDNFKKRLAN